MGPDDKVHTDRQLVHTFKAGIITGIVATLFLLVAGWGIGYLIALML